MMIIMPCVKIRLSVVRWNIALDRWNTRIHLFIQGGVLVYLHFLDVRMTSACPDVAYTYMVAKTVR